MKKLFTLIAAVICAVCVNAKVVDLLGAPVNLDDADYGWYPGLCIEKSKIVSQEAGVHILIDYTLNEAANGHSFKLATAYTGKLMPGFAALLPEGQDYYGVSEDGTYDYVLTQEDIDLLNNNDAISWDQNFRICGEGITVNRVYIEVSDVISLLDSPVNLDDADYGWYPGLCIEKSKIVSQEAGVHILISYTLNEAANGHSFKLATAYTGKLMPGFAALLPEGQDYYGVSEDGTYDYVLTQEDIDLLNDNGAISWDQNFRICGEGITITSVIISSSSEPTAINNTIAPAKAENNVRYNLLGVKNGNGIYIMNGKKYLK
ncbi:MAG: hypothetical protein ACI3YJ_03450 [Prevotella sp.]